MIFALLLLVPEIGLASVIINEVLFDPAGTDTGLEKIELYNAGSDAADLSGWELYPDGIGYYVFPSGVSFVGHSFFTIHLRASGTDDAVNRYHPLPTANMGNSSGSVALFRPGGRSADTIVDFVRYHKPDISPPPAERKTWEAAAAEAGLWTAGAFVDVSSLTEGSSIGLIADGARASAASWKIFTAPNLGSSNSGSAPPPSPVAGAGQTPPPASGSATSTKAADAGSASPPTLRADAGGDATAIAGATVEFRGQAYGLNNALIPNARFLWNFGDGGVQEGKAPTHVYFFPGTYHAHLSVSSGELAGADWRIITVHPPKLVISEVKPGDDGFVELSNAGTARIDLAGIRLTDDTGALWVIPANTLVAAQGVIVFPNPFTNLKPLRSLTLADAHGVVLDSAAFVGSPGSGSWVRGRGAFVAEKNPTPGFTAPSELASQSPPASATTPTAPRPDRTVARVPEAQPTIIVASESEPEPLSVSLPQEETARVSAALPNRSPAWLLFAISAVASAFLGVAAVALKRKFD